MEPGSAYPIGRTNLLISTGVSPLEWDAAAPAGMTNSLLPLGVETSYEGSADPHGMTGLPISVEMMPLGGALRDPLIRLICRFSPA